MPNELFKTVTGVIKFNRGIKISTPIFFFYFFFKEKKVPL